MITVDEMKRVAALAKIEADENRLAQLAAELNEMLELADMAGFDVSDYEAVETDDTVPLREDVVLPSLPIERIMRNAREAHDGFFVARG